MSGSIGPGELLLLLAAAHYLADYPLQGEFLAVQKNPDLPEEKRLAPWEEAMNAHCVIHAGLVALLTGSAALGLLEWLAHMATDIARCKGLIGYETDQRIHLACKLAWWALALAFTRN